ncbi:MAG TPA: hypothetical protein VLA74_01295 [Nitrososphaeraceae archaeon]|nr:hypothetical protein [Nitrososphaeraceae archaeon]
MKTKILKSISNNSNNLSHWPENPSFIFPDLCYCGHESSEHNLDNNRCSNEFCKCRGFWP